MQTHKKSFQFLIFFLSTVCLSFWFQLRTEVLNKISIMCAIPKHSLVIVSPSIMSAVLNQFIYILILLDILSMLMVYLSIAKYYVCSTKPIIGIYILIHLNILSILIVYLIIAKYRVCSTKPIIGIYISIPLDTLSIFIV